MNPKAEELKARTRTFAVDVIRLVRIGVVLEESDESELWLGISWEVELSRTQEASRLHEESREFVAMFSAANITARGLRS